MNPAEQWLARTVWARVRKLPATTPEPKRKAETEAAVEYFRGADSMMVKFAEQPWASWEEWYEAFEKLTYQSKDALFGFEIEAPGGFE